MGKVKNILQTKGNEVFSVESTTTVNVAIELMLKKNIEGLTVTHDEKLIGVFTELDYVQKLIEKGKFSKKTLIRELMDEFPATVSPDTSIEDCMKIMIQKNTRHLAVIEKDKLVGLISMGDVVKYIFEEQQFIIENLEHYITGH